MCLAIGKVSRFFITILFLMFCASVAIADDSCRDAPKAAVVRLPAELVALGGDVYCTPYGHVIASRERWIWTAPGAYNPVFLPSQMVRENPKPIGHEAHFTRIAWSIATPGDEVMARAAFWANFDRDEPVEKWWRLDLTGHAGRSLVLVFFANRKAPGGWGVWCDGNECRKESIFMMLDMSRPPSVVPR